MYFFMYSGVRALDTEIVNDTVFVCQNECEWVSDENGLSLVDSEGGWIIFFPLDEVNPEPPSQE